MLSHKSIIGEKIIRLLYDRKYVTAVAVQQILGDDLFSSFHPQSVRNALSKLVKKEMIRVGADGIVLRSNGRKYVEQKIQRLQYFDSPFLSNAPKNLLVLFDIPEDRKGEREWFRKQLREFGYVMIQKSVWLGPSPLPKAFVHYVKTIGLESCIKTFRLARTQQQKIR